MANTDERRNEAWAVVRRKVDACLKHGGLHFDSCVNIIPIIKQDLIRGKLVEFEDISDYGLCFQFPKLATKLNEGLKPDFSVKGDNFTEATIARNTSLAEYLMRFMSTDCDVALLYGLLYKTPIYGGVGDKAEIAKTLTQLIRDGKVEVDEVFDDGRITFRAVKPENEDEARMDNLYLSKKAPDKGKWLSQNDKMS